MTFSAGGKQYVAIEVGYGGAAEHWQNDIFPEMWKSKTPNVLYVFSL
jgi:alcohol dehydrogenase (cytochrome c)